MDSENVLPETGVIPGYSPYHSPRKHYLPEKNIFELFSADCKRGRRKGATSKNVKNRQTVSNSFSTLFDNFRAGQKTPKIVKKRQKVYRHFSTIFARHLFFFRPLLGGSDIFRLPFHDFDFFEFILENYPIPIAFV